MPRTKGISPSFRMLVLLAGLVALHAAEAE